MFSKKEVVSTIYKLTKERYGVNRPIGKSTTFAELKFDKYDIMFLAMACEELYNIHMTVEEVSAFADVKTVIHTVLGKLKELGILKIDSPKQKHNEEVKEEAALAEETPSEEVNAEGENDTAMSASEEEGAASAAPESEAPKTEE